MGTDDFSYFSQRVDQRMYAEHTLKERNTRNAKLPQLLFIPLSSVIEWIFLISPMT